MKPERRICRLCFHTDVNFYPLQESARAPNDLYSTVPADLQATLQKILNLDGEVRKSRSNICQRCHDELYGIYTFTNRRIETEKILHQIKEVTVRLNKLITFPLAIDIKQETESDDGKGSEVFPSDINRPFQGLGGDLLGINDGNAASAHRSVGQNKVDYSDDEALSTASENDIVTIVEILEDEKTTEENEIEATSVVNGSDKKSTDDGKHKAKVDQELQKISSKVVIFKCDQCISYFRNKISLKRHVTFSHAVENYKVFACNQCNAKFRHENGLKSHKEVHLGKSVQCSSCSITFKSRRDLSHHKIRCRCSKVKLFECNKCEAKFTLYANLQNHKLTHANGLYKCNYRHCTAKYKEWSSFTSHKLSHTKWLSFKCGQCNAIFVSADSLRQHVYKIHAQRIAHARQRNSICDICYASVNRNFLQYHKTLRHSGSSTDQNSSVEQRQMSSLEDVGKQNNLVALNH